MKKYYEVKGNEEEISKLEGFMEENNIQNKSFENHQNVYMWGLAEEVLRNACDENTTQERVDKFVETNQGFVAVQLVHQQMNGESIIDKSWGDLLVSCLIDRNQIKDINEVRIKQGYDEFDKETFDDMFPRQTEVIKL